MQQVTSRETTILPDFVDSTSNPSQEDKSYISTSECERFAIRKHAKNHANNKLKGVPQQI